MGSSLIKVENICIEEAMELLLLENEEVIQAFSSHAPQKTLTDCIGLRGSIRRSKHLDATGGCHSGKIRPEFLVIIPDEVCRRLSIRSRLSQLLCDPNVGRKSRHTHVDDLSRVQFYEEKRKE